MDVSSRTMATVQAASLTAGYAVVTSDKHGTIVSINSNAGKMFGYASNELLGEKVNILMPAPFNKQHDTYLDRYQKTKKSRIIGSSRDVTGLRKDGTIIHVTLSLAETETERGSMFIAMFEKTKDRGVVVCTDLKGKIVSVKGNCFLTFGMRKAELLERNVSAILPEPIAKKHDGYIAAYLEDISKTSVLGHQRNMQARHKLRSEPINISLYVKRTIVTSKVGGNKEKIDGFRAVMVPVDDMTAMVQITSRGTICSAAEEFEMLFGYESGELKGISIQTLLDENVAELQALRKEDTASFSRTVACKHRDGSTFSATIEVEKVVVPDGTQKQAEHPGFVAKVTRSGTLKAEDKEVIQEGSYMGLYCYGKVLGGGFFGKVRLAVHRFTGERVAVKTLRKKQYESVQMEYPPREIAVLKQMRHPNVNQLYDTVVLDDRIHLILEYVNGRELCEMVEAKRMEDEEARRIFGQLLLAVEYMHDKNMVHRDLKLENIIVNREGVVKLIDMGFGNFLVGANHMLRTFCGSPDYAAPELFEGKAYRGKPVDVWSLGVVLYAMLSGLLPFRDSHAVLQGDFMFPSTITPVARDLISKILVLDPVKRLTVKEVLEHPWVRGGGKRPEQPPSHLETGPDSTVLQRMEDFGMDTDMVADCLKRAEHNQLTTTYFLLRQKFARDGKLSAPSLEEPCHKAQKANSSDDPHKPATEKRKRSISSKEDCIIL